MDAYFAQPAQECKNALGEALSNYARVSENLYRQTFDQSTELPFCAMAAGGLRSLTGAGTMVKVWFGIRHALLNPLARVITHIREIASGDLTLSLSQDVMKLANWRERLSICNAR